MASQSTWIMSMKVILISAGVLSLGTGMKYSVPAIVGFVVNDVPLIWSGVLSWLKPPYLYVVINGIIITIAATSRFLHKLDDEHNQSERLLQSKPPASDLHPDLAPATNQPEFGVPERSIVYENKSQAELEFSIVETLPPVYESEPADSDVKLKPVTVTEEVDDEDSFVISRSTYIRPQRIIPVEAPTEIHSPVSEKPLVSSRFGHRKPLKAIPEVGRALRVAKPRSQETLENTWKTITEGRHVPLTRHMRKSDTWEHHSRPIPPEDHSSSSLHHPLPVPKSETFGDGTNYHAAPISVRIRREPSLSQDEVNRRVEAFIKKFNDEMRLQRQESLNRYTEMIKRGAH